MVTGEKKKKKRDGRYCKIIFQCFCVLSQKHCILSYDFCCVFLQMYCAPSRNFAFSCKTITCYSKLTDSQGNSNALNFRFFLTITMSPYVSVEYRATWTTFMGYLCPFWSLKATVLLHCNWIEKDMESSKIVPQKKESHTAWHDMRKWWQNCHFLSEQSL